jgi:hypothetical protein
MSKTAIRRALRQAHLRLRGRKREQFIGLLHRDRSRNGVLLDVGGGGMGGEFAPLYAMFERVIIVNPIPPDDSRGLPNIELIVGDGRCLPLQDESVDWVFCNAVIEHVGDRGQQQRLASEIQRVARRGYFVTTPNRYFPIEPHAMLPFYQFYPEALKPIALRVSPGYMRHPEKIELLSRKTLGVLFPGARVRSINLASSLVAFQAVAGPAPRATEAADLRGAA